MSEEENEFHETKWRRIRRVKRWLRPLPRRATIHRYPVLKIFSEAARKRVYIWSFRVENAVPAIYAGSILTLMPLYGIQLPLSLLLALLLRGNLPILAGLQIVSNPLTVIPIWFSAYQIGRHFLGVIGVEAAPLARSEVQTLLFNFTHGHWGEKMDRLLTVFGVTSLGSIIMGTFFGLIGSISYRIVASRTAASYAVLKEKVHLPKLRKSHPAPNEDKKASD
ncbi:DUF2062 domain-containing protein [Coraliomargarita sinensis]|uniref:DUF2062 domain-containing protein n=1 Tax=Coraliomargarita sinensis TaxID=2174842 RepID=A0A317ZDD9_9BACT|nr:DUF2062 domain-containing protein [Coraliomargarita sinensis]PXA03314.1 DUF2062 domain-containing protein [Coraliomargarita sinensis]